MAHQMALSLVLQMALNLVSHTHSETDGDELGTEDGLCELGTADDSKDRL